MKRCNLWMLALVCAGVQSASVLAVEPMDSLEGIELQDVQVYATRASKVTPMAYSDLSQEDIKSVNFGKDIPYLMSLTPSVTVTSDAGNGIGYTSLRVRGTDPSRINITANGVPMNDPESSTLFWVNMGDFASSVKSMQIQRGVGTSQNGAGAFGATVNMLTENVGAKPFVGLDASAGWYGTHKETLRFGTGMIGDHWGVQGRLSNISSDGYLDRAWTRLNSYFVQGGYFGDNTVVKFLTWNGVEKTYHAWNYTSKYEQRLYGRTYNSCGEMGWDSNGYPNKYYDNQTDNYHQQNYQLIWNQQIGNYVSTNVALHYTHGDGYYEEFKGESKWKKYGLDQGANASKNVGGVLYKSTVLGDLVRQKKMRNDFFGAVASAVYNNHEGLEAILGGGWNKYIGDHFGRVIWTGMPYFIYNDADGNKLKVGGSTVKDPVTGLYLTPDHEYYRDRAKKTDFNIFGKVNYEVVEGLNVFADLQYRYVGLRMQDPTDEYVAGRTADYVIKKDYNFFNPKAGVTYIFNDHHRVYASYAIAHKEPVRNNFRLTTWNKVKAERLNDLEVGYKFEGRRFAAGANIYWMNYKDQFVLTGELDDIGEAVTRNLEKSYRLGIELQAAWMPADWFRWDANATWSRNRVNDMMVTLVDGTSVNIGSKPLSFSPDLIFNNIFTFAYKGFKLGVQSQYISDQYLTNTGFKVMEGYDENGNATSESLMLKKHFNTNIDLNYTFAWKQAGIKEITAGVTLYNVFSSKYDNNGWAAPQLISNNGNVKAVNMTGGLYDMWAVGFAPSAPFHMMGHVSVNF